MDERSERLAPVTYLPGVLPADRSFGAHPAGRARPSFAAIYGDEPGEPEPDHAGMPRGDAIPETPEIPESTDERRQADLARAENVSMHALTRRGQSRRELERTLRARELPDDVIEHEIERLERVGLIDDIALAQNLVGVLQERKGLGRTAIASELTRRLLSPAAIEYALELVETGDELARARELAVKRAAQLASYDRETAERRLAGYLARRGYSGSTVRAAVQHALAGRHAVSSVRFR
ncbi:MAG: regulatory protein RecX [Pseudolysinimonas sp.]